MTIKKKPRPYRQVSRGFDQKNNHKKLQVFFLLLLPLSAFVAVFWCKGREKKMIIYAIKPTLLGSEVGY